MTVRNFSMLHYVHLGVCGGIQTIFLRFLNYSRSCYGYHNSVWLERPEVHRIARLTMQQEVVRATHPKYVGRVKIPGWPKVLRATRQQKMFADAAADSGIIWDGFNRVRIAQKMRGRGLKCIYWEHGASWGSHYKREKTNRFWHELDGILCNSNAARRMLELRREFPLPITVCLNGVPSSLRTSPPVVRELPSSRPFRFGTAGHLRTDKGGHIAIAAIAELAGRGIEAELWIAGTGPKCEELKNLARRLGVAPQIRICGFLADMQAFYDALDCYIHPSVREAFGLVCAEAMLAGCPVIASEIDGLPEAVTHGETGLCLRPRLAASEFAMPETKLEARDDCVYDPRADEIVSPKFVDPGDLADAMVRLITDTALLSRLSRNAIADAQGRLSFEKHMKRLHHALIGMV